MLLNCGVEEDSWESLGLQRRSNQSILKEINPEYSLEGLMLQYFGHLMRRANSLEKILMLGKIEGRRRREWQRTRWLDGITNSMNMSMSKLWGIVKDREAWHATVHGISKSLIWLSYWTTTLSNHEFTMKTFNSKATTQIVVTSLLIISVTLITHNMFTYLINLSGFILSW